LIGRDTGPQERDCGEPFGRPHFMARGTWCSKVKKNLAKYDRKATGVYPQP